MIPDTSTVLVTILGLGQALTLFILSRVKKETSQVNTAVNHVEPGALTLTKRVDVITEDLELVKSVALVNKVEVNGKLDKLYQKTDAVRGMVAELSDAHTSISAELAKIRESVDRRKEPRL